MTTIKSLLGNIWTKKDRKELHDRIYAKRRHFEMMQNLFPKGERANRSKYLAAIENTKDFQKSYNKMLKDLL